jgi:hypothetical protein
MSMANLEHLEILGQGVEAWNKWRAENPNIEPELTGADLVEVYLEGVDFSEASLYDANLVVAELNDADLRGALLRGANLRGADLSFADLRGAWLYNTNFAQAKFDQTKFENATLGGTVLGDTNLSGIIGLDACRHISPSIIDIATLARSGPLPGSFLRGCGLSDEFITYARTLLQKQDYYSCFISYSSKDQDFAERLHADLQAKGVRVWFAPHDMRIGARIRATIDESINAYDKLLLVLSETSMNSQWVEQEVETALAKEREQKREVLFPIRLDDTAIETKIGWPAFLKNSRHIGDFRQWKVRNSYNNALERLLRDLKAEAELDQ